MVWDLNCAGFLCIAFAMLVFLCCGYSSVKFMTFINFCYFSAIIDADAFRNFVSIFITANTIRLKFSF